MKTVTAYWINKEVVCKNCLTEEQKKKLDQYELVHRKDAWIWCHRCNQLAGSDKVEESGEGKAQRF
jgi:hypothetical protein